MKPIIQFGSVGQAVKELQILLNKIQSALGRISEDGAFGQKTRLRVIEFQRSCGLTPDGIVGPGTWGRLLGTNGSGANGTSASAEPASPASQPDGTPAAGMVSPSAGMPANEAAARDRIVQFALQNYQQYGGWKQGVDRPSPTDPRVAGKLCADRSTRLRQGGKAIMNIFTIAGGPAPQRCLTLTEQAEAMYQRQYSASERNNTDIVSWCGIFSLYVHRSVGLKTTGWPLKYSIGKPKAQDEYRIVTWPKPGDIGVVSPTGLNHHFVVTGVDDSGISSVDGNAGALMEIVQRAYSKSEVKQRQGYFLSPVWEKVLA